MSSDPARSFQGGADPEPVGDDDVRNRVDPAILEQLARAVDDGDYEAASAVLRDNWFDVLMGLRQGFVEVLERIPASKVGDYPLVLMMLAVAYNVRPHQRIKGMRYFAGAARAARSARERKHPLGAVDRALILSTESAAYRLIGRPQLGVAPARAAVAALDGLSGDERDSVQALSRIYAHVATTQYYAGEVDAALDTFEKGLAESPETGYSHGFANLAMAAGIHALRGDIHEAEAHAELAHSDQWTDMQRSWYPGTFYRVAEATLALERYDPVGARAQLDAMVHDRRTIEHWVAIAITEALTELVAGRPAAGLAGIDAFTAMRGAEGRGSRARNALAPTRALLHLALGEPTAASNALRQLPGEPARQVGQARVELALGRPGAALRELRRVTDAQRTSRLAAEGTVLEVAALLRIEAGTRRTAAIQQLGEALERSGQRLALGLLPEPDFEAVREALTAAGHAELYEDAPVRPLLQHLVQGPQLTERERVVLAAFLENDSVRDVADELVVSVNTVKSQLRSITRKLGASTRDEAIAIALDRHLLEPRDS